jgi:hypothetical protein
MSFRDPGQIFHFWLNNPGAIGKRLDKNQMIEFATEMGITLKTKDKVSKDTIATIVHTAISSGNFTRPEEGKEPPKKKLRRSTRVGSEDGGGGECGDVRCPKPSGQGKFCKQRGWKSFQIQKTYGVWKTIFEQLQEEREPVHGDFCERECGGGGDCLFHVIAYALQHYVDRFGTAEQKKAKKLTQEDVRSYFAESVTLADMDLKQEDSLINQYVTEKKLPGWSSTWWDPNAIVAIPKIEDRLSAFQAIVQQEGFYFQGDAQTLRILQKTLTDTFGIGFIMMTEDGTFVCRDWLEQKENPKIKYWVFFVNIKNAHFRLVGYDVGDGTPVQIVFPKDNLPQTIQTLFQDICIFQNKRTGLNIKIQKPGTDIIVETIRKKKKSDAPAASASAASGK